MGTQKTGCCWTVELGGSSGWGVNLRDRATSTWPSCRLCLFQRLFRELESNLEGRKHVILLFVTAGIVCDGQHLDSIWTSDNKHLHTRTVVFPRTVSPCPSAWLTQSTLMSRAPSTWKDSSCLKQRTCQWTRQTAESSNFILKPLNPRANDQV